MKKYLIEEQSAGIRLDKILAILDNELSRVAIQRMIENENILVNNKKIKPSYKVNLNDEIIIIPEEVKEVNLIPQEIPLDIIYEDNDIIIVNKAKGMVVHPGNGNLDGTLANAIMAHCKESLSRNRWRNKTWNSS